MEDVIILTYPVKSVKNNSTIRVILNPENGSNVKQFYKDNLNILTPEDIKREDIVGIDFVKLSKNAYKYACYLYSTDKWTDEIEMTGDVVKAINSIAKKYNADFISNETYATGDILRGKQTQVKKRKNSKKDFYGILDNNFRKMI